MEKLSSSRGTTKKYLSPPKNGVSLAVTDESVSPTTIQNRSLRTAKKSPLFPQILLKNRIVINMNKNMKTSHDIGKIFWVVLTLIRSSTSGKIPP